MEWLDGIDPIWRQPAKIFRINADDFQVRSHRTGNFSYPKDFEDYILRWSPADKAKISTWILDRNLAREPSEITDATIEDVQARRPLGISQKIERFLRMLDTKGFRPGDPLPWRHGGETVESIEGRHETMLWIEASSDAEFEGFQRVLIDGEILALDEGHRTILGMAGYEKLERLRQGGGDSRQGFVAMWFDDSMQVAYEEGIRPAIIEAGYDVVRIDRKEHNNKIDDEIIAEIRRSRFVVADFTCSIANIEGTPVTIARGGVYYEAGFAQGLGIPVIWTVRADQISHVHFDTRQFNHIAWQSPEELSQRLYNRIAAVIGLGPSART